MRIGIVGKFPPIQGGVSMRTFRYAHALARSGHEVHVITNAREVAPPYRMFMREEDWARCEAGPGPGRVQVHWTDPVDISQRTIPMASPFVSKLASLGVAAQEAGRFDVLLSYYLEPYAVAGHLIAEITGCPHVIKTAGSDAGRLRHHPQLGGLYRHLFRNAEAIICAGALAADLQADGITPARLFRERDFRVDDALFTPDGPLLDVDELIGEASADPVFADTCIERFDPGRRYIGLYGKLGRTKGIDALLEATAALAPQHEALGLLVMGQDGRGGGPRLRETAARLGIGERVVQIPFLPHWRVPAFIRRCVAVCCLEQGFPIAFHTPVTPREVMGCGRLLITSLELAGKLPLPERVIDGYNAAVLADAHDPDRIAVAIGAILAAPDKADVIAARGRRAFEAMEAMQNFPARLEGILEFAAGRGGGAPPRRPASAEPPSALPLARLALGALDEPPNGIDLAPTAGGTGEIAWGESVLACLQETDGAKDGVALAVDALRIDLAIAGARAGMARADRGPAVTVFRLAPAAWGVPDAELDGLAVRPNDLCRLTSTAYDANAMLRARALGSLAPPPARRDGHVLIVPAANGTEPRALVLDDVSLGVFDACRDAPSMRDLEARLADIARPGDVRACVFRLFELGAVEFRD